MDDQELNKKILDVLRKNRGKSLTYVKVVDAINELGGNYDMQIYETLKALRYQGKIGYNLNNMGYFLYDDK